MEVDYIIVAVIQVFEQIDTVSRKASQRTIQPHIPDQPLGAGKIHPSGYCSKILGEQRPGAGLPVSD